jgi:hypothetical protein
MPEMDEVDGQVLRDPYEVLGVERDASPQEIKSACMNIILFPFSDVTSAGNSLGVNHTFAKPEFQRFALFPFLSLRSIAIRKHIQMA